VPGQLTCGNCGHSWWSGANSARTRCGGCRSVVTVPARMRDGASGSSGPLHTGSPAGGDRTIDGEEPSTGSGLVVLIVLGICVVAIVVWVRHNMAPKLAAAPWATLPIVGAQTRWFCGHEANLQTSLAPGVTVATARCPTCGCQGILGQRIGEQFVPMSAW
jgi:transcription elongation factor Elf1